MYRNPALLAVVTATFFGITIGSARAHCRPDDDELRRAIRKRYIRQVPEATLQTVNERNIGDKLDKFTHVLSPAQARVFYATMNNIEPYGIDGDNLYGLTSLRIANLTAGGASYECGLAVGDMIESIDGESVVLPKHVGEILVNNYRNPVTITIKRANVVYNVLADPRETTSRRVCGALFDTIAYINIDRFVDGCARDFRDLMEQYIRQGAKRYLLDLRGNPGGYSKECVALCELFSRKGDTLAIYTNATGASWAKVSSITGPFVGLRLEILVDHESASASEFVCLVGQDNGFAVIVGEKTGGKGRSTTFEDLSDGRSAGISTDQYFSRRGRSIDYQYGSDGIQPDVAHTWHRYMARWFQNVGADIPISPRAMVALRTMHPVPNSHVVDSLMRAHAIVSDEGNRIYFPLVIWGRLGMAVEAIAYDHPVATDRPAETTSPKKRRRS